MKRIVLCLSTTFVACIAWASPAIAGHVNCGDVLTQDTTLDSDLVCPGDALDIGADGVTLNLAGYEIRGPGGPTGALAVDNQGFDQAVVRDGRITDFGIAVHVQDSTGGRISGLTIDALGISLQRADGYQVRRNVLLRGSIAFTFDAESNLIQGNRIDDGVIQLIDGYQNVVDRNRVSVLSSGFADVIRIAAAQTIITRNLARGGGITLGGGSGLSVVDGNHVADAAVGIWLSSSVGTTVSHNRVTDSTEDGIRVAFSRDILLERNFSRRNGDDGIDVDSVPTTVTGNVANGNGDLGIEAISGTTDGGGNKARRNGNPAQCTGVSCN